MSRLDLTIAAEPALEHLRNADALLLASRFLGEPLERAELEALERRLVWALLAYDQGRIGR